MKFTYNSEFGVVFQGENEPFQMQVNDKTFELHEMFCSEAGRYVDEIDMYIQTDANYGDTVEITTAEDTMDVIGYHVSIKCDGVETSSFTFYFGDY